MWVCRYWILFTSTAVEPLWLTLLLVQHGGWIGRTSIRQEGGD